MCCAPSRRPAVTLLFALPSVCHVTAQTIVTSRKLHREVTLHRRGRRQPSQAGKASLKGGVVTHVDYCGASLSSPAPSPAPPPALAHKHNNALDTHPFAPTPRSGLAPALKRHCCYII